MCDAPQPLVSTALWRGGQGVTSLHASHDIGTARQQHLAHTRTPDPMPTPLRAWGAERGRLRARAAVPRPRPSPIATERRPQFPGHASSEAEVVDMLLFVSQAERVRARGSHRRALRFRGLAFALQSHANPGIRRAEVRAFARIASTECTPPACMQRCARGAGQGDTGRRRAISPSTRPFTPRPGHGHITPAVGPD